jgi:hypothetical protein
MEYLANLIKRTIALTFAFVIAFIALFLVLPYSSEVGLWITNNQTLNVFIAFSFLVWAFLIVFGKKK